MIIIKSRAELGKLKIARASDIKPWRDHKAIPKETFDVIATELLRGGPPSECEYLAENWRYAIHTMEMGARHAARMTGNPADIAESLFLDWSGSNEGEHGFWILYNAYTIGAMAMVRSNNSRN